MPLSLRERQAVVRELAPRYRKAAKHERSQMFDQIPSLCRYDRGYAARALRHQCPRPRPAASRPWTQAPVWARSKSRAHPVRLSPR